MSIGDFLNDQSLGSWADEMETQPMPSAPSGFGGERRAFSSAGGFGDRGGDRDRGFGSMRGGFEERPRMFREQLPLPTKPPYTAHLGNLSYDVTDGDLHNFLAECEVTSVRIVEDKLDKRPKGFGYVEFGTLEGLKKALTLSETPFQGRNIKISVAEPSKERGEAREINDWTRKGPLPDLPGQPSRRPSDRAAGGFRSFDPAADPSNEQQGRRSAFPESDGKTRDFGNWERKGPLSPVTPQEQPQQGGRGSRDYGSVRERKLSPAWGEGRSDAGSRPPRREFSERPPPVERTPTAAEQDTQWRARMKPDAPAPTAAASGEAAPVSPSMAAPPKPAERPRLNLQKRTVSEAPQGDNSASSDSKSSPFGAARPIDTSAREREVEEKRQVALRQKKEADDKAREEKKAREAAAKASISSPTDSARDASGSLPRENGTGASSSRKNSSAEGSTTQSNKTYEILRRSEGDGEAEAVDADHDSPDANMNGEVVSDKEVKPREIKRQAPAAGSAGVDSWRRAPPSGPASSTGAEADSTSAQLEDDGFTVVGGGKKKGRSGGRALAS